MTDKNFIQILELKNEKKAMKNFMITIVTSLQNEIAKSQNEIIHMILNATNTDNNIPK